MRVKVPLSAANYGAVQHARAYTQRRARELFMRRFALRNCAGFDSGIHRGVMKRGS